MAHSGHFQSAFQNDLIVGGATACHAATLVRVGHWGLRIAGDPRE
jgi:hypothetical protein